MVNDIYFIKKTFQLARKAEGLTSPNPIVGAVLVKNNKIISQGFHKKAGLPHAEIEAIRKSRVNLKGATIYVSLEPCCHFGRTPPCVDEIIKQKIKRVVFAIKDPSSKVGGRSIDILRREKIEVSFGICEEEARRLNEVFFKNCQMNMPFVAVKVGQTLDGKIATKDYVSKWITSEVSRDYSKSLRDKYDCVLVGINTVLSDNPGLNGLNKIPYKAVIDYHLRIPINSRLVCEHPNKLIVFTSGENKAKSKKLISLGVRVIFLKKKNSYFSVKEVLKNLYQQNIMSVFVEGGSETIGRFFNDKLVDKIYFFIAPKILGGNKALTSVGADGFLSPNNCPIIKDIEIKKISDDILISGYPSYKVN